MNFLISIFLFIVTAGTLSAATPTEKPYASGKDWSEKTLNEYALGQYSRILEEIDMSFQDGMKNGKWKNFIEKETQLELQMNSPEGRKEVEKLKIQADAYIKDLAILKEQTIEKLKKVADAYPEASIAKIIQELAGFPKLSKQQQANQDAIFGLDYPIDANPGDSFQMQLRQIARDYKIKKIILEMASKGDTEFLDLKSIDNQTLENYFYVLRIHELHEMLELSKNQQKAPYISQIQSTLESYPLEAAEKYDLNSLYAYYFGIKKPANEAEKKVVEILQNHEDQKADIFQKHASGYTKLS